MIRVAIVLAVVLALAVWGLRVQDAIVARYVWMIPGAPLF